MSELRNNGIYYEEALEVVSQEMGHFRPEITVGLPEIRSSLIGS